MLLLGLSTKEQTGCPKADAAEQGPAVCSSESWAGGGWGRYSQLGTSLFGWIAPCFHMAAFPYLLLPQLRLGVLGALPGLQLPCPFLGAALGAAGSLEGAVQPVPA